MRIFLLSPANTAGVRAQLLLRAGSSLAIAQRLQTGEATIGETFAFLSSLYFRGKLAYANRFASPESGVQRAYVITSSRGLVALETPLSIADLREFSTVDIDLSDARYTGPLTRDLELLAAEPENEVVLLGSVATAKYVDLVLPLFGERALYPASFLGRGDMSRGALLLRSARDGLELDYLPISGVLRKGGHRKK